MPVVISDPGKLKIILLNLINNAVKFTEEGEVCIVACHHSERGKMLFNVKDTGIGIALTDCFLYSTSFAKLTPGEPGPKTGLE